MNNQGHFHVTYVRLWWFHLCIMLPKRHYIFHFGDLLYVARHVGDTYSQPHASQNDTIFFPTSVISYTLLTALAARVDSEKRRQASRAGNGVFIVSKWDVSPRHIAFTMASWKVCVSSTRRIIYGFILMTYGASFGIVKDVMLHLKRFLNVEWIFLRGGTGSNIINLMR